MNFRCIQIAFLLIMVYPGYSQQTVGLIFNDSTSFNGYTLFAPSPSNKTYLIDNCGYLINEWTTAYTPGLSVYLMENGNLMRTARISSGVFSGGGSGGRIEEFDWDNNLLWSYNYSTNLVHQHHDIDILPNGNILVIAWEFKSFSEAITQGRDPNLLNGNLWPNHIVELEKVGNDDANIVWEWHSWDHLIQDYDSTKANFGVVADHPELINLNYTQAPGIFLGYADWMHVNSVDYNESLDQIIISNHNFSEVWIIDHSTTSEEASGHSGGNYGKGGDLLYRFGNPRVYDRGTEIDQILFGQHDAHWIPQGYPNEGKIMVFNNAGGGFQSSAVDIFSPPSDAPGYYSDPGDEAFGPLSLDRHYTSAGFYSPNISGAQQLQNGNILICEGATGTFFEIDENDEVVWTYINPVSVGGPLTQGSNPTVNAVFRATRYAVDCPAFEGKDLTPGIPIELEPIPYDCEIFEMETITNILTREIPSFTISNPFTDELIIQNLKGMKFTFTLYDLTGKEIMEAFGIGEVLRLNTNSLKPGLYVARIVAVRNYKKHNFKIIKPYSLR